MTSAADVPAETVTYCQRWNNKLHKPIEPLNPAAALRKDRAKEWYTAVLGDPAAPRCYVELAWENNHVGVWFLDDELRRNVHYSFTRLDETIMFMDAVGLWYYADGAGRSLGDASRIEMVDYSADGHVRRTSIDVPRKLETVEEFSDVPLDINWEPVPAFGDYRSVTRLDREPPIT